jgi:hypothetical protein
VEKTTVGTVAEGDHGTLNLRNSWLTCQPKIPVTHATTLPPYAENMTPSADKVTPCADNSTLCAEKITRYNTER